ncbi:hypothetical protein AD998_01960 [bacterium 336/3]|nr:hypothetical protein AD998_01960 [bacterium 336/3]
MTKPILAFLLALVFFASCRKPQEMKPQTSTQQTQLQNDLIVAAQEWFKVVQTNYKKNASLGRSVNLQDLPWMPQWGKAKFYPISEEETLVLIPVWRYADVGYNPNFGFARRLKIIVNHTKQTMTGVIAEMIMEKSTLERYQDDMFYYAHMQMLQGNKGKFVYYELAVDNPLYLLTSINPNQKGNECQGDEHPTKLFTIYVTFADVCMVFYTDGCTQWVEFDDCGTGGGGGLNPVNTTPPVVTIPNIPPLNLGNFPGMLPTLIPINSPINLPPIPSPTPWLPWLSYPVGGGDYGGGYPIDPGSNVLVPENPLTPEDQRVLDQLDKITERYGLLVNAPNNPAGYIEMYKIEGQDRLQLARSLDKIIKSHPAYKNMYNLFISKNIKITWQLNLRAVSNGDAKATIKEDNIRRTNYIIFKYASTLKREDIFAEELIHILQLDKLGAPFEVPSHQRVCIEFEAKATVAMLSKNGSGIYMYGLFDEQNIYKTTNPERWDAVQAFKDDFKDFNRFEAGTILPKNRNQMDWTTFMSLLAKYKELAPPSYNFTGTYDASSWQWAIMFELFNY